MLTGMTITYVGAGVAVLGLILLLLQIRGMRRRTRTASGAEAPGKPVAVHGGQRRKSVQSAASVPRGETEDSGTVKLPADGAPASTEGADEGTKKLFYTDGTGK